MKYILSVLCLFITVSALAQVDGSGDVMPPDDTLLPPSPLLLTPFTGYFSLIVDAAASPTGEELAVTTPDDVLVFRIKEKLISGGFACRYPEQVSKLRRIKPAKVLLFAPDNQHLLTLNSDGSVKVRDKRDGQVIKAITIPGESILTLAYNKTKSRLLTGTDKGSVWIYDAGTYNVVNKFSFPDQAITCLAATDDLVMAGNRNGGLTLITISSGETKIIPNSTYHELYTADITSDGRYGVCGADDVMMLVDLKDAKVITKSPGTTPLYRTAFTPAGDQVLVGHFDGISGYDLKGKLMFTDAKRFKNGLLFEFIPNTTTMARMTGDDARGTHQIEIVTTDRQRVVSVINNTNSAVTSLAFSADNKKLLFAQPSALKAIDLATGALTDHPSLSDIIFSRDGKTVTFDEIKVTAEGEARSWKMMDAPAGNISSIAAYQGTAITGKQDMHLNADGKLVGYAMYETGRRSFYAADLSGKQVHSFPGWSGIYEQRFEFTPSPKVILNTKYLINEGHMRLINLADTTRQLEFENATKLAYVGPHLVVHDHITHNIRWINTATFKTDRELPLKNYYPKFAAFNSNKTEVAFLEFSTIRRITQARFAIYNVKTRQRLRSFSFALHDIGKITDLLWSPNGKTFIVSGDNGLITIVDAQTGKERAMLLAEHLGVNYVAMDDQLRWTGTTEGLSFMLQVEKEGVPVDSGELQRTRNAQLLKSLLLD